MKSNSSSKGKQPSRPSSEKIIELLSDNNCQWFNEERKRKEFKSRISKLSPRQVSDLWGRMMQEFSNRPKPHQNKYYTFAFYCIKTLYKVLATLKPHATSKIDFESCYTCVFSRSTSVSVVSFCWLF